MYNNATSPIVVVAAKAAKKVFDYPQDMKDKAAAVKKARKDLKKAGLKF